MAESVEQHIAARNAIADDELHHHGFFAGIRNRLGLTAANTVDRVTPDGTDKILPFAGGLIRGAIKGAVLGLVTGCVLAAFGVLSPATVAAGAIYTAMGIGAAVYGLVNGVKSVHEYSNSGRGKLSDRIADMSGAAPRDRAQEQAEEEQRIKDFYYMERDIHGPERYAEDVRRRRAEGGEHQHHR